MEVTAFSLAQRYVGIQEIGGEQDHPLVQWWLSLCGFPTDVHDEVAWCSAFVNGIAWELRLPRSKSAAARSWLTVGTPIELAQARVGYDVVVLSRGSNPAQGHVGWFAGVSRPDGPDRLEVQILGGNQVNSVCVEAFPVDRVVGVRRLL